MNTDSGYSFLFMFYSYQVCLSTTEEETHFFDEPQSETCYILNNNTLTEAHTNNELQTICICSELLSRLTTDAEALAAFVEKLHDCFIDNWQLVIKDDPEYPTVPIKATILI